MQQLRRCRLSISFVTVLATVLATCLVQTLANRALASPASPAATTAGYVPAACNQPTSDPQGVPRAQCFAMLPAGAARQAAADAAAPPASALGPADLQNAYALPDTGQGQTVAIVDAYGDSHAEADLAAFRSYYGLPPCTNQNGCFTKVDQNGGTNYPPDDTNPLGWALETSLDLDAVSAACPKCNILLVQADDNIMDNLGIATNTAVNLGAKFVSNSYGSAEGPDELSSEHYYDHPGVAITAASGDDGNLVIWPASSPNVTAVGGTKLTRDTSTPRGWDEKAWGDGFTGDSGAGSGCSPYEPRPDYQNGITTGCVNRATADISADADPNSGLAVYDTVGQSGWIQVGGTSLASPLLASMYALAGTPAPNSYPVNYPYQDSSDLFDITDGSNGDCGTVLCNAGPGWDGPTGLGTPHGVQALFAGLRGELVGTVNAARTGDPIAGATVSAGPGTATTDTDGHYKMNVPIGSYDVTAQAYGYAQKTTTAVTVATDQTTTADFVLDSTPTSTLSGVVTDGSGHGWPLYAKITIDGYPHGAIYTDPYTGQYSVDLPQGSTYGVHVTPVYPGYTTQDFSVDIGGTDQTHNAAVPVDQSTCVAAAYAYKYDGISEQFTGWTGDTTQDGWTDVDSVGNGQDWRFDNPGNLPAPPDGDAFFASVDSARYGAGTSQDTSLVSPSIDMSGQTNPEVDFDTYFSTLGGGTGYDSTADIDVSVDGGQTWQTVWHQHNTTWTQGHISVPIPQAADQPSVQVRFHYTGTNAWWWELDNVFIGTRDCSPTHAGLIAGSVSDANTGGPVNGAVVRSDDNQNDVAVAAPTPDDPNLPDGFYWLASSLTGTHSFTTAFGRYTPASDQVDVTADAITRQDWSLPAGHITISAAHVSASVPMGQSTSASVTFTNDGSKPMHVNLAEHDAGLDPMNDQPGAPVQHVPAHTAAGALVVPGNAPAPAGELQPAAAAAPPWTPIADYPSMVMDNAVAYDNGKVYSVGGYIGNYTTTAAGYVYDPSPGQWRPIADAPQKLEAPAAAFLGGRMYVIGGWGAAGGAVSTVYAYDPSRDTWSQLADLPKAVSAAAAAVLDGKLYVVGGCTTSQCPPASRAVFSYDPAAASWTQLADYPNAVAYAACAGITGELVCAGGLAPNTGQTLATTYGYDPTSNTWTRLTDMPYDDWGMAYSGADDKLQIVGGAINYASTITNQAYQYDPLTDRWDSLPNANYPEYRGGGACGMYQVGGSPAGANPIQYAEVLPGNDLCNGASDVPWLSESATTFDVDPGQSISVTLGLASGMVSQPGTYTAALTVDTNGPNSYQPIQVSMTVAPPKSWGRLTGTVTGASNGNPIAGASVQVCTLYNRGKGTCGPTYTLRTDKNGQYQIWLDKNDNPVRLVVTASEYQAQVQDARIQAGTTVTQNFALAKA